MLKGVIVVLLNLMASIAFSQGLDSKDEPNEALIPEVETKVNFDSTSLTPFIDQSTFSSSVSGKTFSGTGIGIFVNQGLSKKWGITGGLKTSFATLGAQSSLVALHIGILFDPLQGLIRESATTEVDGKTVSSGKVKIPSSLKLGLLINQYFFNGSRNTVPYSGPGGLIQYGYGLNSNLRIEIGGRYDQLVNGSNSIASTSLFLGASFYL